MYKLPCPDNVLYLVLVGKQPPLGTEKKVASLRPATEMHYIRTTGMMSTSPSLCDLISVTATALHFCRQKKQTHHEPFFVIFSCVCFCAGYGINNL